MPSLEAWLEAERDQLVLWLPVALGGGIAAWFVLPDRAAWTGWLLATLAMAVAGVVLPIGGRAGRVLTIGGLALAAGCALVWWRAESVAAPVLARPAVVAFAGRVERIEALAARDLVRLPLIAAGAGAVAAVAYTWLTGGEVPTIRSCVAALLVLAALALGREAITLRLVAAGALVVMLLWPEAVVGASFQLSFAAVTAIVALHEGGRMRGWFAPRDEGWGRRALRGFVALLATGVAVEFALMPIGLFHFHKAGLYGALANIAAIPLTTFVVMPLEAGALLLDTVGTGAPLWWLCARSLDVLLWIARTTAGAPGAVAALPGMPRGAFGLMVAGGLWLLLWRTRVRWAGGVPFVAGAMWALATPAPDLIVTGDGRHLAIRTDDGALALLRERAGDYVRDVLAEGGGVDGELPVLDDAPGARCNADACLARVRRGGREWRVLATRSGYLIDARALIAACRRADVVVSERRLPRRCTPRWLKLDRGTLRRSGGVTVTFDPPAMRRVADDRGRHSWVAPATVQPRREIARKESRQSRHD